MKIGPEGIGERLRALRLKVYGPRGKARFAKELGIRASTYQEYEVSRLPPVDLLVRAAEIGRCDLVWLLTGQTAEGRAADTATYSPASRTVERLRELLERRPETAQSVVAYLKLIDPTGPDPLSSVSEQRKAAETGAQAATVEQWATEPSPDLIPVVGSTAAGPARFWRELLVEQSGGGSALGADAEAHLQALLADCGSRRQSARGLLKTVERVPGAPTAAALVQFSRPNEGGIIEFLSCPRLSEQAARLIAWRIDGESMAPRYCDGDFVIVSPDQPAVDGAPCVAHQRGQIGANCKLFKREGSDIVLIPVNENFSAQRFLSVDLAWAHRVQYSVRLNPVAG